MPRRCPKVPAEPDQAQHLGGSVGRAAAVAGLSRRGAFGCQPPVAEAGNAIMTHGYADRAGWIRIRTETKPGPISVEIEATAPPINLATPQPELARIEPSPPVAGLGLIIIHRVMDKTVYRRRGRINWLCLVKRSPGLAGPG